MKQGLADSQLPTPEGDHQVKSLWLCCSRIREASFLALLCRAKQRKVLRSLATTAKVQYALTRRWCKWLRERL
jgi:hypothetical protein